MDFYKDVSYLGAKNGASKIIAFLKRYNINLKKSTIQFYLRSGVLPELENNGRLYSKRHIAILVLICVLSEIFTITQIKELFEKYKFPELEENELLSAAQSVFDVFDKVDKIESENDSLILAAKSVAYFRLVGNNDAIKKY
jgi:DNA-binding transcriptional MerR regulator